MRRDPGVYLTDISAAIERIEEYTQQADFDTFSHTNILIDAVIRNLEVIGEAARKLPDEVTAMAGDIEWRKIRGLRNILVHECFGINLKIVWDVVTNKLPALSTACSAILDTTDRTGSS